MSRVETPIETFKKFAATPGWQNASVEELAGDFFSVGNESNLLWNPYFYEEGGGRLFDPVRKMLIAGTANGDGVEEDVNKQLEDWFLSHESGIGVWISPRGGGVRPYPEEQITIYRIAYRINGQKILLCSSHQFKANFRNPEEIRSCVFTENDKEESVLEIIDWLRNVSQKRVAGGVCDIEKKKKLAIHYAYQYRSGVSIDEIVYHMTQTEFLGQNPIGCGVSSATISSQYSFESTWNFSHASEGEGWHTGTCRICKAATWVGPCSICKPCESRL